MRCDFRSRYHMHPMCQQRFRTIGELFTSSRARSGPDHLSVTSKAKICCLDAVQGCDSRPQSPEFWTGASRLVDHQHDRNLATMIMTARCAYGANCMSSVSLLVSSPPSTCGQPNHRRPTETGPQRRLPVRALSTRRGGHWQRPGWPAPPQHFFPSLPSNAAVHRPSSPHSSLTSARHDFRSCRPLRASKPLHQRLEAIFTQKILQNSPQIPLPNSHEHDRSRLYHRFLPVTCSCATYGKLAPELHSSYHHLDHNILPSSNASRPTT